METAQAVPTVAVAYWPTAPITTKQKLQTQKAHCSILNLFISMIFRHQYHHDVYPQTHHQMCLHPPHQNFQGLYFVDNNTA